MSGLWCDTKEAQLLADAGGLLRIAETNGSAQDQIAWGTCALAKVALAAELRCARRITEEGPVGIAIHGLLNAVRRIDERWVEAVPLTSERGDLLKGLQRSAEALRVAIAPSADPEPVDLELY